MVNISPAKLKDLLIKEGIIEAGLFEEIQKEAQLKKQNLIDILISRGIVNRDYLYLLLARYFGVNRVNFSLMRINEKVIQSLPEDVAKVRHVVVFAQEADGTFDVAMADPTDLEAIDFLTLRLGNKIKPFLATDEDLNRGFAFYGRESTESFKKLIEESIKESLRSKAKARLEEAALDLPIVAIVDNLLSYGLAIRASDIHIEILEDTILVRFRIDGILHEITRMPKEIQPAIIARIKLLASLRLDEHTHPQDGRFRYRVSDMLVDVRVSIIPTFYGEKAEMRLLSAAQKPLSFSELGMTDYVRKLIEASTGKTYGMILVCGPTGAGKTTTLYSIMNVLNRPEVNIISIEDPIEYDMRYINQIQINPAAGITFASGLRSILRQDPDVIMVGEIRDSETANISVQSALTGHLVLSSLHTIDAPAAVPRLIDMGVPPFLVAAVLNVVTAQRLARKIHSECIESYVPSSEVLNLVKIQLKELNLDPAQVKIPSIFYRGKGCPACNYTGYLGRIGLFEVLDINENIRRLIIGSHFSLDVLKKEAQSEGMITMFEDGLKRIELGLTTIEEVLRIIRE